jgi:hypothetical protein
MHSAGSYAPLDPTPAECIVYLREAADEQFLVALNFAPEERIVEVPGLGPGRIALSTYLDRDGDADLSALRLRAFEGCVIQLPARASQA